MPLGSCSDCLLLFKYFTHSLLAPIWAINSIVLGVYLINWDTCGGNLQQYLFTCSILIGLWFLIFKLGKSKYKEQKFPDSYLAAMFIIMIVHAFLSVLMTIKISDPSLDKCYESTTSSSTTAFELNTIDLGSVIGKKKELTYAEAKYFFYTNDILSFGLLIYGIYKFSVYKLRYQEGQAQNYEQIRDN